VEYKKQGKGDLVGTLDPGKKVVGEKFFFTPERRLPDPIRKLGEADVTVATDG
jgi:hypothetical protein